MKKTFLAILATLCAALAFTGCIKEEQYSGPPSIENLQFAPLGVTPDDAVTVSATISDADGIKSATLHYTVGGANEQTVAMTANGTTFSGIIPAQTIDSVVELWVVALDNTDASATSAKLRYTVSDEAQGTQSDIRINQVGSATGAKYICLYNTSTSPVDITGMYLVKNNEGTWGEAFVSLVMPGNSFAVYRAKGTEPFEGITDLGQNVDGGISGGKSLLFELKNAEGVTVDAFCNTAIANPKVSDAWDGTLENAFDIAGRVPDGTGKWFVLTDATPGQSNASATAGAEFVNQVDIAAKVEPTAPTISGVTAEPTLVKPEDEVLVKANVVNDAQSTIASVTLKYKINGGEFVSVEMNASIVPEEPDTYSGKIPAQADKAVIVYKVVAANTKNLSSESDEFTYTVAADAPDYDYSKLVMNEIDGNNKAIELYNAGSVEIDLAGCYIMKDVDETKFWAASSSYILASGEYAVLYQVLPEGHSSVLQLTGGISGKKAVKMELFDPAGTSLGVFDRTGEKFFEDKANSFSNYEGAWYYGASTLGAANGVSSGVIGEAMSAVVFNELDGNNKKIEFFNTTDAEVDIAGYSMYKDDGETAVWVAPAGTTIAAGGFFTLTGDKKATEADYATKFASGMSAGKSIKMELKDASGALVDVFIRGQKSTDWGDQTLNENTENSFSRIAANGSWGAWAYAAPTIGTANGEKTGEIEVE